MGVHGIRMIQRQGLLSSCAKLAVGVAVVALVALPLSGCRHERSDKRPREFFPGMDDQPKYLAQAESHFFDDGRTMRKPVTGTVAFGRREALSYGGAPDDLAASAHAVALERADLLRDDDRVYKGINPDGSYLLKTPIRALEGLEGINEEDPIDPAVVRRLVERGQDRFNIFCTVCHGQLGDGKGMVGVRWAYPLPNFHDPAYQPGAAKGQDGYIFHVIRNGLANQPGAKPALRMPSYATQISERDAWAIVLYFRALQEAWKGSLDDVPESQREYLLSHRPATPAKPKQTMGIAAATVEMTDTLQFEPKVVTIKAGQIVEWNNTSFVVHTVTADPSLAAYPNSALLPVGAKPFDSDRLMPDSVFQHTFTVPGKYRYFCKPHESTGMAGEVIVEPADAAG